MAESIETAKWPDLSRWLVVLGWLGMMVFAFHACTHMVAAGDTWVAMACGRHFINHGVDTVEPFSANSHKAGPTEAEVKTWPKWAQQITEKVGLKTVQYWHPTGWINQNWLTHVIFYWLSTSLGSEENPHFNALVYWKFAVYILTVICVYYTARILGAHQILSAVFACFAMFISRSFLDIRPAGFSNLLVAVYLLILVLATYRNVLYIWLIVPLVVFWCNVHGGYIYAFIMLVPFVGLHLLALLPRRWTVPVYSIGLWTALYLLTCKFLNHRLLTQISPGSDRVLFLLLVLTVVSFVITSLKRVKPEVIYVYHVAALLVVFLCLFTRFFPVLAPQLSEQARKTVREYAKDSQLSFIVRFLALTVLGFVVTFMKDRLVCIRLRGLCHTICAGLAAFVAAVLFNPFHLTNLTHTFIISVSKHAERWRDVNEWHPAFEWTNLVGTSFPFFIMLVVSIGLLSFWLFCRRFFSGLPKASKNVRELRKKRFVLLMKVFASASAVFIGWVIFLSCSLLNLNALDFFICALFTAIILLSICRSVHFIYLVVPLTLLGLLISGPEVGYKGRYFYPFVLLPSFAAVGIFASLFSKETRIKPMDIVFAVVSAIAALVLMMVLFNPFKLESAWNISELFDLHRIWRPKYELSGNNHLVYRNLFVVLYIINVCSVVLWCVFGYLRALLAKLPGGVDEVPQPEAYELPRVDLVLMTIAALTIYMAICSRRFIPIAAIAACPVLAVLIDQMVRAISSAYNFCRKNRFCVSSMPYRLEAFLVFAGAVAVMSFGTWWGCKFWRVYIGPWPTDTKLNSVFMRMTASDVKPFYACRFIKLNKLKGKMFNYWTEGGFIAYGQEPDPNDGHTPLKLFMDGRAQAAYDRRAYDVWGNIMAGGWIASQLKQSARLRRRELNADEYRKIGDWIDKQLKKHNVWVILMPWNRSTYDFVRYIERQPDWQLVFLNRKQRLFVDVTSQQGRELFDGIMTGRTLYPDELYKNLIRAQTALIIGEGENLGSQALDFATRAFEKDLCPTAMLQIMRISTNFPELRERIHNYWRQYFDDFVLNKAAYAREDGYWHRLTIAINAASRLRTAAKSEQNTELVQFYNTKSREYEVERRQLLKRKRW